MLFTQLLKSYDKKLIIDHEYNKKVPYNDGTL